MDGLARVPTTCLCCRTQVANLAPVAQESHSSSACRTDDAPEAHWQWEWSPMAGAGARASRLHPRPRLPPPNEAPPWPRLGQGYRLHPHFNTNGSSCSLPPLLDETKGPSRGACTPQSQPASDIAQDADHVEPLISNALSICQGSQVLLLRVVTSLLLSPTRWTPAQTSARIRTSLRSCLVAADALPWPEDLLTAWAGMHRLEAGCTDSASVLSLSPPVYRKGFSRVSAALSCSWR